METKFTPGPWSVAGRTGFVNQIEIAPAICTAYGAGEEIEANARLIAAAPDLLVVAKDFHEVLSERGLFCECGESDCRTTRLRAAIAKATGEQA